MKIPYILFLPTLTPNTLERLNNKENKIDILCMQETEVTKDININELSTSKYCLELEINAVKSRVGFYIAEDLN